MKYYPRFIIVFLILLLAIGASGALAAQTHPEGNQQDVLSDSSEKLTTWFIQYIKKGPNFGSHVSIAFDEDNEDNPWIAYFDADLGNLNVAHFVGDGDGNCGTANNWTCEEVDPGDGGAIVGQYSSIDIHPDTNPDPLRSTRKVGVSYYDASYRSLKYAEYSCPLVVACEWEIYVVDAPGEANDTLGKWSSLKFGPTGTPLIAYHNFNDTTLIDWDNVKYAYYIGGNDGNCGDYSNWECSLVESSSNSIGQYISLDIDYSGNAYIAWYDASQKDLDYAIYTGIGDCFTDGEWSCYTIETTDTTDVGRWVSFHAPQNASDKLRAAYYDYTNGKLKYAYNTSGGGNCGTGGSWQCDVIDDMGNSLVLADISLAVGPDNTPFIAYTDATDDLAPSGLKVAVPDYFSKYANCGGELIYDWYCKVLDHGGAYTEEASYVAAGVQSTGLAMVAYAEWDNYYEWYNLKIAYELYKGVLPIVRK